MTATVYLIFPIRRHPTDSAIIRHAP